jgi:hypothetical protein
MRLTLLNFFSSIYGPYCRCLHFKWRRGRRRRSNPGRQPAIYLILAAVVWFPRRRGHQRPRGQPVLLRQARRGPPFVDGRRGRPAVRAVGRGAGDAVAIRRRQGAADTGGEDPRTWAPVQVRGRRLNGESSYPPTYSLQCNAAGFQQNADSER